jgi:hypothetical protein
MSGEATAGSGFNRKRSLILKIKRERRMLARRRLAGGATLMINKLLTLQAGKND